MAKQPAHVVKARLEPVPNRHSKAKRWRAHCTCGWKGQHLRGRRGGAAKEGRKHQAEQGRED